MMQFEVGVVVVGETEREGERETFFFLFFV